jgi:hypothetical protein
VTGSELSNAAETKTDSAVFSKSAETKAREKWGKAIDFGGYQMVPNILVRTQRHLGLSPIDVVVLLNLNLHWWERDLLPWPPAAIIAARVVLSSV